MVMVAVLGSPHLLLEAQHLGAIFAERTVHVGVAAQHIGHPLPEGGQHRRMVAQVRSLEKLHLRMVRRHQAAVLHDAANQHAGEQEVGEHHHPLVAEPHHLPQARLHQGKGDSGIQGFPPAEPESLHQHAGDLGHVRVGIRIGGPSPHHHQQRVVGGYRRPARGHGGGIGGRQGLADAAPGRLDHLAIHPQLAPVIHPQAGFGGPGVEHRGDVVFGMASGKEHRRHRQHMADPLLPQLLQAIAQDRPRELQVAMGHRQRRQGATQLLRQGGEFLHRQPVAAAVAADQHPQGPIGSKRGENRPLAGGNGVGNRWGAGGHGSEILR